MNFRAITMLTIALQAGFTSQQSSNIVLLSHSPLVSDYEPTTLTCTDLGADSSRSSLFIRRLFSWSGSSTTQSSSTKTVLNQTGMMDTWIATNAGKAIGAFGCGRGDNSVSVVKMHVNGSLRPHTFTKSVTVGSKVVIKMNLVSTGARRLRKVAWYKDGHMMDTRLTSRIWEAVAGRALVIKNVQPGDAGVYMAHHTNEDKLFAAGTILIVRRCTANEWSDDCTKICPVCSNGGSCNEKMGICTCPPGFVGQHCERPCPASYFGANCEHKCSDLRRSGNTCEGFQQCSVSGCTCVSGWMGADCRTPCPRGRYGADCLMPCMCYHEGVCNRYLGCICTDEWTGPSCKTPSQGVILSKRITPPTPTQAPDNGNQDDDPKTTTGAREQKPLITKIIAKPSFMVNRGQTVEIHCSVTGVPSPQHGEIIIRRKDLSEISPIQTKMSKYITTSFFTLIMSSYSGPFWCVATTSAGFTQEEFNFTIPVLPTPMYPPKLIAREATSLKIKLNSLPFIGDGPIERSILLLKRSDEPSFRRTESNINNDTVTLDNLQPFTNYTFRVLLYRTGGESGRGYPGPTAVIQTDCGIPTSGPTIKNIHAKNNSIMFLSWRLPEQEEIKGEVLGYNIYYRELGQPSAWKKVTLEYSGTTSATLKSMKPLAVYSVKIVFYNCAGESPDSKEVRVTMGRLGRPEGPRVSLVNITSRFLGFRWQPPTNAKPYTISYYEVHFEELDNPSANSARVLQNVSAVEFSGSSLVPYTMYRFRVRAYNHEGPGNYSEDFVIRTKEEAPSQPSNFRVSSKTPSLIQLSWNEPMEPNGNIRRYIVRYSKVGDPWIDIVQRILGLEHGITVKELKEYTEYRFQIRAVTIEPGMWSDVILEKTMSLVPLEPPQEIDFHSPTPQSVALSWRPPSPSEYVENITEYKIIHTDDIRQKFEHWKAKYVPGHVTSVEIDGLRSDIVYTFAMAAITRKAGPYSEKFSIRTLQLGPPPPPGSVKVSNVTSISALVNWSIEAGYSIINTRIRVKSGDMLMWSDEFSRASVTEKLLDGLKPDTRYIIELATESIVGESSGNPIVDFRTLPMSESGKDLDVTYKILVPVLGGVTAILTALLIYCKCRERSTDPGVTIPIEMDSISQVNRMSTFGSAAMNSRSGTLLSTHSVYSGNSRAPSIHSGQLALPESLIISWESIRFEDIALGEGNFGQVVKAVVLKEDKYMQTAVKMLKDGCSGEDRKDFLAELEMMVRIGHHKNIISLIGACEHDSCLYLCTEFAPNGNLLQFLRKSRRTLGADGTYTSLTQDHLLQFALDVCQGMAYLSEKQLIHRDLAARNVLLAGNLCCKVADFGLSRGEGVYVKKTVARLPIRWMAIESLNYSVYTTKSDVWSFGVLLWEIVSLGGTPYCGMSCNELYEKLPTGYRMERPVNCADDLYKLMSQCWKDRPYDRPTFGQLCVALRRMIDARSSRNYVNTAIFENFIFATIDANEEEG